MIKSITAVALAAIALSAAGNATAAYVTYSGIDNNGSASTQATNVNALAARDAFFLNLTGVGTQDFESYTAGTQAAAVNPVNFGAAGTALLSGNGVVSSNPAGQTQGNGRFSVPGGTKFWESNASGAVGATNFELNFSNSIAAFGFYGIDIGDFAGTLSIELYQGTTLLDTLGVPAASQATADGSILYFGIVAGTAAEEFNRVRFGATGGTGDVFAFDSFSIGTREQVIPEPASLALVAAALLGLGLSRRKRV